MKNFILYLLFTVLSINSYAQASVTLNSPAGGENWAAGTNQYVIYTTGGGVSQIRIRFSPDYGNTWSTIASPTTTNGPGFYTWTIPQINAPNSCQIKIMSLADTTIASYSGYFSISGPAITLLTPIGGEVYQSGTTQMTQWFSSGVPASESVKLEFSSNGGSSFQTLLAATPNDDSASWIVPNSPSTNCLLKISRLSNPNVYSYSNTFTVTAPVTINLTSPNGGENFPANSYQNIYWSYNPSTTSYINLEYSTDGGINYTSIISGIQNTGYYQWYVPNSPSSTCRVRVSDYYYPNINDASDNNFVISGNIPSCLADYTPFTGTTITGQSQTLYWYPSESGITGYDVYFGTSPNPPLVLSNTQNQTYFASGLSLNTTYYWKIVPINGAGYATNCNVWSFNTGSAYTYLMSDTSTVVTCQGNFYDSGGPSGLYQNYENYTKRFFPGTAGQAVSLSFNSFASEGGYDYLRIYDGTSISAPLLATFNGSASPQVVTATNPLGALTVNFYSDGSQIYDGWNASISCAPIGQSVQLTYPIGGEYFCPTWDITITWLASVSVSNVKLEYSIDGGASYTTITNSTPASTGSYLWTVPTGITSYNCLIRVSNVDNSSVQDVNNSVFYILENYNTVSYPNGGEIFNVAQGYYLSWNTSNCSQYVNLYYSTTNGQTWNTIVTQISNSGSYYWTVPNTPSTTCLFKVVDFYNANYSDISNSTFTIATVQASVQVYYPNGGENFNVGSNNYITWTSTGIDYVDIYYSTNNGGNYTLITSGISASLGYYYWTTPNTPSSLCRVRIVQSSNSAVADVSDNVFNILAVTPTLTVTYPNGGENFTAGSQYSIYWSATAVDLINIDYSTNNGTSWTNIVNNVSASLGSYYWTIPNTPSTQCLVRVRDAGASGLVDASNSTFTITGVTPYITLYYPNGGEQLIVGSTYQVQWNSYAVTNVKLEFSTNNGATYTTIEPSYATNGYTSYYWVVPNSVSTQCLFRVSDISNAQVNDVSNSNFTISIGTPTLTLNYPNGGESYAVGSNAYISWSSSYIINVKLEYSTNGGSTWTTIAASVAAPSGYYYWGVPNTVSSNCYVRVTSLDNGTISDQSNFAFSIVQPSITLNYPNGGETLTGGNTATIYWYSSNISSYVNLEYSTNGGQTWTYIGYAYAPSTAGTYNWTVPNVASTNCKVRVSDYYNSTINDISNANFTINQAPPSITVTSPNGGETYATNSNTYIYWQSISVTTVKLEYTLNNGATWNLISANTPATNGYYYWTLPSTASNNCRVRVSNTADNSINDISNSTFSIVVPSITVNYPNGGESFVGLSSAYINFSSSNVSSSYVNIEYSINNGASWNIIANGAYNNSTYYWNVPNTPSTQCLIKVSDYYNSSVYDVSNSTFTITAAPEAIVLNYPNGGEQFGVGSNQYVSWSSSAISNVKIEFSYDNGSTYTTIIASTPASNGYYYWTIPNNPSTQCKVRVSSVDNASINDASNSTFTITTPSITIYSPNGGESFQGLSNQTISWSSYGISNYVTLEYSIDSMQTWNTISYAAYSNGNYSWTIPNTPSTNCFVRATDYYNSATSDVSNYRFIITSAPAGITVTNPNGFENFAVGSNNYITWNSQSVQNVSISYSTDGGQNFTAIASNINASIGNYLWTTPNTPSANCLVKVSDSNNSLLSDLSNNVFSIQTPYITVTTPNGNENYLIGNAYYIQWNSSGIANVAIEYSTDNGATYNSVVNSTVNYGYYYWNIPNTPSQTCLVRVKDAITTSSISDVSNSTFTIATPTPTLVLTYPNGGENLIVGNYAYLNWYSTGVSNIKIQYSVNNGNTWNLISSSYPASSGSYYWNIPNFPTNSAKVKISNVADSTLMDQSNTFTIEDNIPSILVNYPNGGETLSAGNYCNIYWTSNNVNCFTLSYSTDNGITYTTIAENLTSNSYYWNVPSNVSSNCIIRVQDCYSNTFDVSNSSFNIIIPVVNTNTISIVALSDTSYCRNDSIQVSYIATGIYNSGNIFSLQISDENGNFANPTLLGYIFSSQLNGTIDGLIPSWLVNGSNYRIRVVSSDLFAQSASSVESLQIGGPVVDFSVVNGQDIYYLPQQGNVEFSASGNLQGIASYEWNFGDGNVGSGATVSHTYNDIVYFTVSLLVIDSVGCSTTVTKPNYIHTEYYFNNNDVLNTDSLDVTGVSFLSQTTGCFTLANGNCIVTNNAGYNWSYSYTGVATNVSLTGASLIEGNWFITGTNGTIRFSNNQGLTWTEFITGTNETFNSSAFSSPSFGLAVGTNGTVFLYNGTSWTSSIISGTSSINFRGSAALSDGVAIAIGTGGALYRYASGTWTSINTGFTEDFTSVSFVDQLIGYVVSSSGRILRTADGGLTWSTSLSGVDAQFSAVATGGDQRVYAAGNQGLIYVSEDNGASFARFSVGSTNPLRGLSVKHPRGYVVGSGGLGRAFGAIPDTSTTSTFDGIRTAMNNLLVYPNPSNERLIIKTKVNDAALLKIEIKDLFGKQIELVCNEMYSGEFQKEVNTSKIAAGTYFVHVNQGNTQLIKKIIVQH